MTVDIDIWFDYICPYSLITRQVLARAVTGAGTDTRTTLHPFEVNPHCVEEAGEYPRGVWENSVRPLARRHGVPLPGPPGTPLRRARMAFTGYQYALEQGAEPAYSDLVFHAYFHDWQDISDPVVLTALARRAGLDPLAYRSAILSARYARLHRQAEAAARASAAVTMVPVVVIGSWRIDGVPSRAQLDAAIGRAAEAGTG
ncbi:DsbA family protein [Kitasatospora sp. NPDC057223]|uniref:DsbA family oxidoreductase n=1 Tax=Kitasatospora sp. NPDC057223 TaxID=3346055 RepID=UPI0036422678